MNTFFKVSHRSSKSKARLGKINSDHGTMDTPAFISAATKGTIKTLTSQQVKEIGIQGACVNTYHLVTHPGADVIEKGGGIQKYSNLNIFTMSDSGGFQVFSLARSQRENDKIQMANNKSNLNIKIQNFKQEKRIVDVRGDEQPMLVKISEDGVKFRSTFDGALIEFTPEKSMEFQRKIGADINMAFDECTYYQATHEYTKRAMERTHEWLKRCIKYKDSLKNEKFKMKNHQYLYGVIQGGGFEDLRKKSAEFVVAQNTPGVAIGGVSVGESKKEMRDQVRWVANYLPSDRPVHLLGVGQIDDIIDLVKYGIDTFDCVEPTRLARMGIFYEIFNFQFSIFNKNEKFKIKNEKSGEIDINKSIYKNDLNPIVKNCQCYTCLNFTRSYLHHLFKQREILGYTLATYHNLWVMEKLFEKIRQLISKNLV